MFFFFILNGCRGNFCKRAFFSRTGLSTRYILCFVFFFIKGLNGIYVILGLMFFLGLEPKLVSLPSINVLVYGFKKRVTVRERGD
jgi:hypothetical protein